jgi:hypothetical protein
LLFFSELKVDEVEQNFDNFRFTYEKIPEVPSHLKQHIEFIAPYLKTGIWSKNDGRKTTKK